MGPSGATTRIATRVDTRRLDTTRATIKVDTARDATGADTTNIRMGATRLDTARAVQGPPQGIPPRILQGTPRRDNIGVIWGEYFGDALVVFGKYAHAVLNILWVHFGMRWVCFGNVLLINSFAFLSYVLGILDHTGGTLGTLRWHFGARWLCFTSSLLIHFGVLWIYFRGTLMITWDYHGIIWEWVWGDTLGAL